MSRLGCGDESWDGTRVGREAGATELSPGGFSESRKEGLLRPIPAL
jgi:hypothetical protein